MKCARCPAEAVLESLRRLLPGEHYASGLKTEWLCVGCAREGMGLPRELPVQTPKKKRKPRVAAKAAQKSLFE